MADQHDARHGRTYLLGHAAAPALFADAAQAGRQVAQYGMWCPRVRPLPCARVVPKSRACDGVQHVDLLWLLEVDLTAWLLPHPGEPRPRSTKIRPHVSGMFPLWAAFSGPFVTQALPHLWLSPHRPDAWQHVHLSAERLKKTY